MAKYSLLIFMVLAAGCNVPAHSFNEIVDRISSSISKGDLDKAISLADSLRHGTTDNKIIWKADSLKETAQRIPVDFSLSENDVREKLQKIPGSKYSVGEIARWEADGWLEYRTLNGVKKYFNRAVSNLVLLRNFYLNRPSGDSSVAHDPVIVFRKKHTEKLIKSSGEEHSPAEPVSMDIVYTVTVVPDAVPDGEIIRCWLPYPKEKSPRQKDVYLLGISNENFILSPDSSVHRSIYMEEKSEKGKPTIFRISYNYTSSGQYFDPVSIKALPYNKASSLYRKYTSEQPPQISFTVNVRRLADSITGSENDPAGIVRKLFYWFNKNIPWAGALEYSIMPNIPEYVITNRRGDCGMQTFLFMSMLRYKGVPVKWQSGWMVPPGAKNLHDWCEVYFEGTGWVPVDISYGLQFSDHRKTREFYLSGLDSYRLIVNDGVAGDLYPKKNYLRSEPFDFQRGEVEWKGGNLYFDKWDYEMKITYKNQ